MARTFWDRVAKVYDFVERSNRSVVQGMAAETVKRIPKGANFLECAAGTGVISIAAASAARQVRCTDLSLSMLKQAKEKAQKFGLSNIEFAQRDLLHLQDADGSYDAVCAANVLHLLNSPDAAVRELWRVTASGGVLLLPTFLQGQPDKLMKTLIAAYKLFGFSPKHAFTLDSYRQFFESMSLPLQELILIPGRLPVGLAVLKKP